MVLDEYDFWLLDLDGTLVDVEPAYARGVFDAVGDRLGRSFSDREVEIVWHGLGGSRDEQLREWGLDVDAFWTAFHDVEDPVARAEHTYFYDDAAVVAELDVPVGLVTHCQAYLTEPVLDQLDVRDWFDAVVCCTAETGWKPDPTPVELAMAELGVDSDVHAGALAGDGPNDVGAAWNAGLDGVHVERHDPERRGQCVLGDYRVETFRELADGGAAAGD
ncbi:MAG: HAD family hydrolase [Haloarculaceae archaeon]